MPEPHTGNDAEAAFRALIRVYGLIGRIMQPYFGRMGISGSQWGLLRALYRAEQEGKPGLRILELGDKLLVRPPSVSGLVNRLQRLGHVRRVLPKSDLRVKEVHLTNAGRELVRRVLTTHRGQIELLMGGLNQAELQQLSAFMERLARHLKDVAGEQASALTLGTAPDEPSGAFDIRGSQQ